MASILNGALAGLVAITPAAGLVQFNQSIIIVVVGTVFAFIAVEIIKPRVQYLDVLDAFGIHAVAGIVGTLLTGLFAKGGNIVSQAISVVVVIAWSVIASFAIAKLISLVTNLHARREPESLKE